MISKICIYENLYIFYTEKKECNVELNFANGFIAIILFDVLKNGFKENIVKIIKSEDYKIND